MAHHALVVCVGVSEWHEPCHKHQHQVPFGLAGLMVALAVCVMAKDHGCWCFTLLWHAGLVPPLSSCLPPLGVGAWLMSGTWLWCSTLVASHG